MVYMLYINFRLYIHACHLLKSCRSKMATLAHYVLSCTRSFFIVYKNLHNMYYTYILYYIYICVYIQGFPYCGDGESPPTSQKFSHPPSQKWIQTNKKTVIFNCSHCSCTIFVLISCSFDIQVMLILILFDVQDSQNAVFSFEKFSYRQNHSSSGPHHLVKKSPQQCSLLFDTKSGKLLTF